MPSAPPLAAEHAGEASDERGAAEKGTALRPPTIAVPLAIAAAALALATYPSGAEGVIAAFAAAVLVVLAAIDIDRRLIPNRIVLPSFALVLLAQIAFYPHHTVEWLASAAIGAGALLLPRLISRAWMGMGDVKMMLLVGAALGWPVAGALLLAFAAVFPVSLVLLVRGGKAARKATIPFGPFLALGGLIELLVPHL